VFISELSAACAAALTLSRAAHPERRRHKIPVYCAFPKAQPSIIIVRLRATRVTVPALRVMKYCETSQRWRTARNSGSAPGGVRAMTKGRKSTTRNFRPTANLNGRGEMFPVFCRHYELSSPRVSDTFALVRHQWTGNWRSPETPGWKLKRSLDDGSSSTGRASIDRASSSLPRSIPSPNLVVRNDGAAMITRSVLRER